MTHDSMAAAGPSAEARQPRVMLVGFVLGVAAMAPSPMLFFWPFAPIAALLPTAVFTVGAIWSRTCADLALGGLAAAMFGTTAILTFLAAVTII